MPQQSAASNKTLTTALECWFSIEEHLLLLQRTQAQLQQPHWWLTSPLTPGLDSMVTCTHVANIQTHTYT